MNVDAAFKTYNESWTKLNKFEPESIESLLIRKEELEDWFIGHENNPDESMIRDEYRRICQLIESKK